MIGSTALIGGVTAEKTWRREETFDRTVFVRVREEVDLRKVLPTDEDEETFDRYNLRHCISPDHNDRKKSMLVYSDGCHCLSCGFKADAVDAYLLYHPELNKYQAAEALLSGEYTLEGGVVAERREPRQLDQDLAVRYHLSLAENKEALAGVSTFGFSREAIQYFKLGWARVLVRLDPEEVTPETEGIEWRERNSKQVPYQWQWRYSVPVYSKGRLVQVIYRKANAADPGPKVTIEKDAGVHLFNSDALRNADTAVITGGWGDSIACWHWGIAGVNSTAGDGHFSYEWLPLVGRVKRLYIVGDADSAGQKMMARIRERIPWAVQVELPWEAGSKRDIRDLLLAGWTKEDFLKLLKGAEMKSRWKALKR